MSLGAHISIPAESFLEELSQKLEVHPISVYWLLNELREQEGVVDSPELRRYIEDYFTVMVLRLLGHRWPKQIEAGELTPEWADPDGIVPLTVGTGERTLLDRVRERIAIDFGQARVDAIEQEFRQIMGRSLPRLAGKGLLPASRIPVQASAYRLAASERSCRRYALGGCVQPPWSSPDSDGWASIGVPRILPRAHS